jgi:hypothetical protein
MGKIIPKKKKEFKPIRIRRVRPISGDTVYIGIWKSGGLELPLIIYDDKERIKNYLVGGKLLSEEEYEIIGPIHTDEINDIILDYTNELSKTFANADLFTIDPWPALDVEGLLVSNMDIRILRPSFEYFMAHLYEARKNLYGLRILISDTRLRYISPAFEKIPELVEGLRDINTFTEELWLQFIYKNLPIMNISEYLTLVINEYTSSWWINAQDFRDSGPGYYANED